MFGRACGCGISVQAGRSGVRFSIGALYFLLTYPSAITMAVGPTKFLTEMSTRGISWGVKAAGAVG